jgi:hypothetical protein
LSFLFSDFAKEVDVSAILGYFVRSKAVLFGQFHAMLFPPSKRMALAADLNMSTLAVCE